MGMDSVDIAMDSPTFWGYPIKKAIISSQECVKLYGLQILHAHS